MNGLICSTGLPWA